MADSARAIELIKKIAADEALRDRLTAASDTERLEIVRAMGFSDIDPQEVAANADQFAREIAADLDDAELEAVTGGVDTTTTTTTTVTASASAAVAT